MNENPDKPTEPRKTTPKVLFLAFAPAALLVAIFTLGAMGMLNEIPDPIGRYLLWVCCIGSVACCFISAFMLFRRGTVAAIGGGLLLILLNGFIAFFFGCCASFRM